MLDGERKLALFLADCDECHKVWMGDCPKHGPLTVVEDQEYYKASIALCARMIKNVCTERGVRVLAFLVSLQTSFHSSVRTLRKLRRKCLSYWGVIFFLFLHKVTPYVRRKESYALLRRNFGRTSQADLC